MTKNAENPSVNRGNGTQILWCPGLLLMEYNNPKFKRPLFLLIIGAGSNTHKRRYRTMKRGIEEYLKVYQKRRGFRNRRHVDYQQINLLQKSAKC